MAESVLGPPPFREALVVRAPLTPTETWQRWLSAFWEQMQTTAGNAPGPGPWQPQDATLSAFAGLAGTPNTLPYFTGPDAFALTALSPYSRSLLDDPDAATWRSTLGLGSGSQITASGAVNKVGVWQDATTMTYDTQLHWDMANDRLGICTATPATTLHVNGQSTFSAAVGIGYAPVGGTWLRAGSTDVDTLLVRDTSTFTAASVFNGSARFNQPVGIGGAAGAYSLINYGTAYFSNTTHFAASVGINIAPSGFQLYIGHQQAGYGIVIKRLDSDTNGYAMAFTNVAAGIVGSITCTGTATAFNTTSDARLKEQVMPLQDALARVRALRPVAFRWRSDGSAGEGFLAHEAGQVIPQAVTGEAGAVNTDGSPRLQGMDHSKLVPWLVGAVQELAARLDAAGA